MASTSIVVPTYCESENVPKLVEELVKHVKDFELIVVDDNSPDRTWLTSLESMAKNGVRGIVVRRLNSKGLATAVLLGIQVAKNEIVVVMDADLQHPPSVVPRLVEVVAQGCDIAIASRYVEGGSVEGWSFVRKTISKGAILLARLLLPQARSVRDPVSGFFAIKRSLVLEVLEHLDPEGFKILLELLVKTRWRCVKEIPYSFGLRIHGKSKLGVGQILRYVKHLMKLCSWRPLRFAAVGLVGTVVNLASLMLLLPYLEVYALASAIAIELSIINNFVLHEAWTFSDRRTGSCIRRFVFFHFATIPAIAMQYIVSNALYYTLSLHPALSQFAGIVLGFVLNYVLCELGVWKYRRS